MYFVIAQNYEEYKTVFRFFDDIKKIYIEGDIFKKVLNTLSIFVFWIIVLIVLNLYI